MNRLALGTVQFGLDYGVANKSGQTSQSEAIKIISLAKKTGIDMLDTAIAYGSSEQVLGDVGVGGFKVVTKLPPLPREVLDVEGWVQTHIEASCIRLKTAGLYAVLIHRSADLFDDSGRALASALRKLKDDGIVQKIGVSVYDPDELTQVIEMMTVDLAQVPLNVIDRRMETSGWLSRLKDIGVEIHSRSSFLQGLLLMNRCDIPKKFEHWGSIWDQWHRRLNGSHLNALSVCLSYPMSLPEVNRVVIGVDSSIHLKDIIAAANAVDHTLDTSYMSSTDTHLINPSYWNNL